MVLLDFLQMFVDVVALTVPVTYKRAIELKNKFTCHCGINKEFVN